MEVVGDALPVEKGARLLHRIAVLDAVDGDGHFVVHSHSSISSYRNALNFRRKFFLCVTTVRMAGVKIF
jgi:hypothetical protein